MEFWSYRRSSPFFFTTEVSSFVSYSTFANGEVKGKKVKRHSCFFKVEGFFFKVKKKWVWKDCKKEKQDKVFIKTFVLLSYKSLKVKIGSKAFYLFTLLLFYPYYSPLALSKPEASGCFIPVKSVNISS